jgi:hypothetical protein
MHFGNSSKSVIPVPDFYHTRTLRPLDTFNTTKTYKPYFRPNELFLRTQDINLGNNLRNVNRRYEQYNKTKNSTLRAGNYKSIESNKASIYTQDDSDDEGGVKVSDANYRQSNYRTELRDEIKSNLNSLAKSLDKRFDYEAYITTQRDSVEPERVGITFNLPNDTQKYTNTLRRKVSNISGITDERRDQINKLLLKNSPLPYLTQKNKLEDTVNIFKNKCKLTKSSFTKSSCFNTNNDAFYKPKRIESYTIKKEKFNANIARSMFCENYDHKEFLNK